MASARREPVPTPDTQRFWDAAAGGALELPRCVRCDQFFFYPRSHCPKCLGDQVEWSQVSGRGTLHTYVISHLPAPGFDVPYVIAIVELEEGPRMMTNIIDVEPTPEHLVLDMPVEVVFVRHGSTTIPNFRPVEVRR